MKWIKGLKQIFKKNKMENLKLFRQKSKNNKNNKILDMRIFFLKYQIYMFDFKKYLNLYNYFI